MEALLQHRGDLLQQVQGQVVQQVGQVDGAVAQANQDIAALRPAVEAILNRVPLPWEHMS